MGISLVVNPVSASDVSIDCPLAGYLALAERGQCADGCVERGDAVYQREARPDGRAVREAGHRHHPAERLPYGVEPHPVAVGAVLAVGGDVDHDDPGVEPLEDVVAEAHLLDGAGPEVLEEDVGHPDQIAQHLLALVGPEVDREALLPAVVLDPVGALPPHHRAVGPALVAVQRLDLYHLGAQAGEHQRAPGPGLVASQVEHAYAFQRGLDLHAAVTSRVRTCGLGTRPATSAPCGRGRA